MEEFYPAELQGQSCGSTTKIVNGLQETPTAQSNYFSSPIGSSKSNDIRGTVEEM